MKKTVFERLAALLCAAAMVLTILPLPAAAEDGAVPTISVETYSVAQGGSATVYVYGKNLTSFHTLTMNLFYDSEILTYKSCSSSSMEYALGNGETAGQVTVSAIHSRGLTVSGTSKTLLFRLYFDVSRNAPLGETPLQIDITYASDASGTITPDAVNGTLKITEYVTPVVTFNLKGNSAVQAGERIELILNSSNLKSLCGGQFAFQYDDKVFRYESLELLSAMKTDTAVQSVYAQNSGQVILSYASATKPSSGDLMKLTLTALENAEGESEISLRPTSLYDVNREVLQSTSVSKTVTVTKLEVQPVFPKVWLDIPEELTMDQPFTVTVMVSGDGNISAADMQFTYDSTLLEVTDVAPAQSSKEDFSGLTVTANPAKFQNGKGVFTVISMEGITEETALVNITLKALENPPSAAEWETQIAVSASGVVDRTGDDVVVQPGTSLLTIQVPVYTVTFLEHDGTLLKQQPVFYLNAAAAPEVQGKEANDQQHFLHSGWDHDFSVITTDLTVTAVYQAETHNFEDAVWQRKDEQLHVRTCTGCTVQESASHRWDEGKETTAPGCITAGVMTYICTDCSAVREEDIAALDHDWDEGTVTTPATCTGDGILTRSCSRCDQKQLETIKAPGHQESAPVKENIVAATCTSKGGYDEVVYCSVCHEVLKRTPYETEKLAHTEGEAVQENYQAATCTQDGSYDTVTYCTVCKAQLSRVHTTLEALGHDYAEDFTVDKEPTCTAEGSQSRHCSVCDDVTEVTVIEALGHDWDKGVVTTAPTCTADGVLTETCARCKATQTKAITAAGHKEDSAVQEKIVEATCTAAGSYDEVIYCSVCHEVLKRTPYETEKLAHTEGEAVQENYQAATCTQDGGYDMATYCTVCKVQLSRVHTTLEAPGHDYAEDFTVDKAPTCTAEGSKSRHCSVCDEATEATVIEALGHDWDEGVVTTAPTCTVDGVLTRTCTRCDQQQTEAIKAPGHQESDPVKENIVAATCTSKGSYDEVVYCSVCDAVLKRTPHETDKLAHTEGAAVQENYQAATCTQDGGYDMVTYCTVCKVQLSRVHTTLEAPGHDYAEDFTVDKAPTCTAEGSKSRHCSVCDDVTEVTVIEALGHDWDEGVVTTPVKCTSDGVLTRTCTRCDQQQTETIKAPGHQESDPVKENIVPATCTSRGSYDEVVYCSVCDAVLKRTPHEIDKLAHTEGQAVQENYQDATCTENGGYDMATYCTVCKAELSRVSATLEAPGHDYAEDFTVDKEPTCTAEGSKSRHCSRCDEATEVTVIEARGHDWDEGVVTTAPTCTVDGVLTEGCTRCDATQTKAITAAGHKEDSAVRENIVDATCTAAGSYDEVIYCSVCDAELSRVPNTIPLLAHTEGEAVQEETVDSTCTSAGSYDLVVYCTVCHQELSREHQDTAASGHDYDEDFTIDKASTCTEAGSKSRHCSRCNSKTDVTAIEALGHDWNEGSITKLPSCTETGTKTKICLRCSQTMTETVAAKGHTSGEAVQENPVAPTCTETGSYESVVYCSVCNAEISRSLQTVEKLGHAPKEAVTENRVEPSCEAKGGYDTVIYCGRCASELSREHTVLDALGHDYAESFTVDREPTCVAEGSKSRHCSRCESKTDITAIEELGHAWGEEIIKAATCTEDGSVTKSCSRCDVTEVTTLSALGHTQSDAVKENEKAPSCTETGSYESVVYCSVCNAEISRSLQIVEKLGHAPEAAVTENRVEPSCEGKGGYDTVIYCGRCASELSREHTVLDALGHDYAESFTVDREPTCVAEGSKSRHCSRCESKTDITAIEELGHAWGEETIKAATCTEDGSVTKNCSRCDVTEVTTLSALGHTQSDAVKENEKAPSCTENGSYESVIYCSVCSAEISRSLQTVEKLGHAPKEAVTENRVEPSCEGKGGYDTVIYCGRCSSELSRVHTVLDALGHDYAEDFTVDRDPTCVAEGSKSRHCSRCDSKTDITAIEERGHAWGEEIIKAATCTEDGSVTKSCTRCDVTEVTTLSALGHTQSAAVKENEKAPNCTENGSYESVVYCSVCNAEISRSLQTVEKLGHAPKEAVTENRVEPSCEGKGGYDTVIYCSRCSSELSRVHTVLDALGHDYAEDFTVDRDPTCVAEGSKSRHCSRCDSKTDITAIEELGHAWGEEIIKAATCTEDGSVTKSCSRCNTTESAVISALGHKPGSTAVENEKKPNCVDAGSYEEVVRCTVCSTELSRKTVTVSALGHAAGEEIEENRVEPSCQTDGGYELASYCQVCHKELKRSTVVLTKLGHDYAKTFTVDQEATCTSVGSKSRHCSRCDSKTEVIELAALGHSWDEGIITTAPTCTANGIRTKTCIRCDATKDEGINALGHVYNAAVRENEVAASCMAAGSYDSVIYCAVCQTEISRISKVIEMLAHTLGQPTVENEREPSCTVDGGYDTVVRCTVCNTVVSGEHTVIGKLGHTYGKPSFQWADDLKTCTASFYCNVCEEDTENKLLTVSCSVTENETERASCSKEGKKTITAMAVLGEMVYTAQQTQSIPMTDHRVDTWTAEGIEGHSAVCKDCKKTVNAAHSWQEHACSLCGQKDAYLVLDGDTVTVFAVNIEAGTKILIAGYAEGGRCISVVAADWGTENDLQVKLPSDELVQKVYVYFADQNWTPIRSHIEQ